MCKKEEGADKSREFDLGQLVAIDLGIQQSLSTTTSTSTDQSACQTLLCGGAHSPSRFHSENTHSCYLLKR